MATAKKSKLSATVGTTPRRNPTTVAPPRMGTETPETKTASEVMPEEVERLAYQLWEERGRPEGNALEDWNRAQEILMRSR